MCVKDVQLGRKKIGRVLTRGALNSIAGGVVAPLNPNRATLVLAITDPSIAAPGRAVAFFIGNENGPVVAVLTDEKPVAVLTVEEFGEGCTGQIVASNQGGIIPGFASSEFVWNEPVENI